MSTTTTDETTYDLMQELKQFDETKRGVKGLVDKGLTTIPPFFIHPKPDPAPVIRNDVVVPTVDLSKNRKTVVEEVARAAREMGFFQVVNHGVPVEVLEKTLNAIRGFHELDDEEKSKFYGRAMLNVAFFSNVDLFKAKAASWRDTLQIRLSPIPPIPEKVPEICRNDILEWDEHAKRVAEVVMELLSESLGLDSGRLKDMKWLDARVMVGHYYPFCPDPEITAGIVSHADPGVLTMLLQDQVGGLQVMADDGSWVDVKPVPGALVVNVGDLLQIMSNGEYRSAQHRVLANSSKEARVSIAIFYNTTNRDGMLGPFEELITPEKSAVYGQFMLSDYMQKYFSRDLGGKPVIEYYKL